MITLDNTLNLDRCPHCSIDFPNLTTKINEFPTLTKSGNGMRYWKVYTCQRCGGAVIAASDNPNRLVTEIYPERRLLSSEIPTRVKQYLQQAIDSVHSPSGSLMLCSSSVDAMLKELGLRDGSLYTRINQAAAQHLITEEMAKWSHQVRLEANEQRHADDELELPTVEQAKQGIEFSKTLAEILFVIPAKVTRGIEDTSSM